MQFRLTPLAALMAALGASLAQGADTELDTVVVSATRRPVALDQQAGQVYVVTAEDAEKRNALRVGDIVNQVPGLLLGPGRGVTQVGGAAAWSLRGIPEDRRTLVLWDGVPVNDGFVGSVNFAALPTDQLSQAEVLYGPMSSMYGGNAVGGVISFITRMPEAFEFRAKAGYGTPFRAGTAPADVVKTSFSSGTKLDNGLKILGGLGWTSSNGYRSDLVTSSTNPGASRSGYSLVPSSTGGTQYLIGDKGRSEMAEYQGFLKLEQRVSSETLWRFAYQRQASRVHYAEPASYVKTIASGATYLDSSALYVNGDNTQLKDMAHVSLDQGWGNGLLHLKLGLAKTYENSQINPTAVGTLGAGAGRISDSPVQSAFWDAYWTGALGVHDLTAGMAYRGDRGGNRTDSLSNWQDANSKTGLYERFSGQTQTLGYFLQDDWHLSPDVVASLGARYDDWKNREGTTDTPGWASNKQFKNYDTRRDGGWSPKLGLRWNLSPALALRTSAGSAFRAPSVYELYASKRFTSYTIMANPDLKPETVDTLDIGADFKPWQGGQGSFTLFKNRMHDLIYVMGSGSIRNRYNLDEARSQGAMVTLRQSLGSDIWANASYTYTSSRVQKSSLDPSLKGKRLSYLPEHMATLGVDARRGPWSLATHARYASKQYSTDNNSDTGVNAYSNYDAYALVDSKLSYRFDKQVSASFSVDNLLDRRYNAYYPAPRRSWFAELSYQY